MRLSCSLGWSRRAARAGEALLIVGVISLAACDQGRAQRPSLATPPRSAPTSAPLLLSATTAVPRAVIVDAGPPPLRGELVELEVAGFGNAVVSLPTGTRRPRPVVIAAHGNYDTPASQCRSWRRLLASRAFVLCPRGVERLDSPSADDIRYTFDGREQLEREVLAGLEALEAIVKGYLAPGPVLWTGFSLGAILGAKIAARHPKRFPYLILTEGGHDAWTAARSKQFASGGGRAVAWICGSKGCELAAKNAARRVKAAGSKVFVGLVPKRGHVYGGQLGVLALDKLAWLTQGDDRWATAAGD